MQLFHVWGRCWKGDVLYGTFSTEEKAKKLVEKLKLVTAIYNDFIDIEEVKLDPEE